MRAAVEEFWNDLKRAHYIDIATRAIALTLPLRSNYVGVRSRVWLLTTYHLLLTTCYLPLATCYLLTLVSARGWGSS